MTPNGDMPAVIVAAGTDVGQASYVQWLESMFIELRGQGVQWTPDDVARACRWRDLGVPLATTRRVLGSRIATWRAMNGTSPAPFSLRYYEPAVLAAMGGRGAVGLHQGGAAMSDAGRPDAGQPDDGEPDVAALQLIADLVSSGSAIAQASSDPAVADATRRAVASLRKALQTGETDAPLLDAIAIAREGMRKRLLRGIGTNARVTLESQAAQRVGDGLDREATARRQLLWIEALLSEELGVLWPTLDGWQARIMRQSGGVGS
jgi:hypothetical protein